MIIPRFPTYIPSRSRYDSMLTSKALTKMNLFHRIVVEPQEVELYEKSIKDNKLTAEILLLDMDYINRYESCDNLGLTKIAGPGPVRNFIWDHSIKNGDKWHWVMDDNIKYFSRQNNGKRIKINSPIFWTIMEDFVLQYKNIYMAGPNYTMFSFCKPKSMTVLPPFYLNTRIYSCNFIRNDIPFRWRGRYNDDTILSLDILKAGGCTVLFNGFLQCKSETQTIAGGLTELYVNDGTLIKSQMLVRVHPDVSKIVYRFGRIHHHVNYNKFKKQMLIRKEDAEIKREINEYGLILKEERIK